MKSRNSFLYSANSSKIRARRSGSENPLESCSQLNFQVQFRSKIRDQRDKRDSRDLRDPAKIPGLGPGPGRKIRKSGSRNRDRDSKLKNPGSGTGTGTQIRGTRESGTQLGGTVPRTEIFPRHGPGPVPTSGLNWYFSKDAHQKI